MAPAAVSFAQARQFLPPFNLTEKQYGVLGAELAKIFLELAYQPRPEQAERRRDLARIRFSGRS